MWKPWILDRCREVQENPDSHLDLWSREHYKSTIITYGKTIQDLLIDSNRTIGIFSHNRPIAKAFLRQIKREFESNTLLKQAFPDVLWKNPQQDAPKWSEDEGIILKRSANPKEASVEAWGLVDGQPVSKHFWGLVYDDVVVQGSVTTPEMLQKTVEAVELSYSLGSDDGVRRAVGTRYHYNDAYRTMMDRGSFQPRIRLATHDGTMTGDLAIWSRDTLQRKRTDMGPYTFACHGPGTLITMADWTEKAIVDVEVGDVVLGFEIGNGRTKLKPTRVLAVNSRVSEAWRYMLETRENGICTEDHNWWSGRTGKDTHRIYAPLGMGQTEKKLHALVRSVPRLSDPNFDQLMAAKYLAGIYDGEGTCGALGSVTITQCERTHPEVCNSIRSALKTLDMQWTEHRPKGREQIIQFVLREGRHAKLKLLRWGQPAKWAQITRSMFGSKCGGVRKKVKLTGFEPVGKQMVFNIQTETGNYVANGFVSKNCQILQNPVADNVMGFKREWMLHYEEEPHEIRDDLNVYLLVDAASSKRKGSDYTVMWTVGLGGDQNAYILDIVRDRLNLTERAEKIMDLHRKWKPNAVRYESYGMQGDIEHIQHVQKTQRYRFNIDVVGGQTPKNDRIRRLMPWFENGRFYFPKTMFYRDYEGLGRDMVQIFMEDEFVAFPVSVHDDMLDSLARLLEPDLPLTWPRGEKTEPKRDRYADNSSSRDKVSAWY